MPYIITITQRVKGDSRSMQTSTTAGTPDEARELLAPRYGRRTAVLATTAGIDLVRAPDGTIIEVREATR